MSKIEKLRRLIPDVILKKFEKLTKKNEPIKEYDIIGDFKYLDNTALYFEANIYAKIWYLRSRFNWFISLVEQNPLVADAHLVLLKEIKGELIRLAYLQTDMNMFVALFNLSYSVQVYYEKYINGKLFTNQTVGEESVGDTSLLEDLWMLKELYDESKLQQNFSAMADIGKGIKLMAKRFKNSADLEDYNALMDIYVKIKEEICFLKSVEREK